MLFFLHVSRSEIDIVVQYYEGISYIEHFLFVDKIFVCYFQYEQHDPKDGNLNFSKTAPFRSIYEHAPLNRI